MGWIKHVIVDLVVTLLIVLVSSNVLPEWVDWIVLVYTPFMLVLKAIALFGGVSKKGKKSEDDPPAWFFHVLYAINFAALLYAGWFITAGQWFLIWLFSFLIEKRG